ncbi:MAG: ABC transporter permease [Candidatus Sumerlaeota bacterium]|nr:ABC transporter permease [Candidatus Sumerlaeota bacterium]
MILIEVIFLILAPSYRSYDNFSGLLEQSVVLAIMAVGTTVVLISGGLDLSVGSNLALVTCVVGAFLTAKAPVWMAVSSGLIVGLLIGMLNGLTVIWTGVPSFIVTLGTMMIARGFANMLGEGRDMSAFPDTFKAIGFGYKVPVTIAAVVVVVVAFLLAKTKFGFNCFAIGGNEEVARLSGVPVKRYRVMYYSLGGLLAGLAAVVETSRFDFATPNRGDGYELQAIAAAVIGGTSLFGGMGGVGRTIIGVLIIKSLYAGLIQCGVGSYWQLVAIGCVIIVAVWIDYLQRRQRA